MYYKLRYYRWKYSHRIAAFRRLMIRNQSSRRKIIRKVCVLFLLLLSLQQLAQGGYIYTKAIVAQHLIAGAWQKTLSGELRVKPWAWADTWPVAQLISEKDHTRLFVLAGDNARTLAFGPGYRFGSGLPGGVGNSIISGHRDTHFAFLRHLKLGDKIEIQNANGEQFHYRVSNTEIVSIDNGFRVNDESKSTLTLVTCYPFDAIQAGGKLRYIVTAEKADKKIAKLD